MTFIFKGDHHQNEKFRLEAREAAKRLKNWPSIPDPMKVGFAFDDGIVTIEFPASLIRDSNREELADAIFSLIIEAAQSKGTA